MIYAWCEATGRSQTEEGRGIRYYLYVDGGARGNPGPGASAAILTDERGGPLAARGWFLGRTTNNVAEYTALLRGLELAKALPAGKDGRAASLVVRSDSELLVRQVRGEYRVKNANLKPLYVKAMTLLHALPGAKVEHIPREQNGEADRLANRAMDAEADVDGSD